jgi:hypothetical protein
MIIITFLLILITLLLLDINNNIKNKKTEHPQKEVNQQELFANGANYSWITVQVALYKMWQEMNILDFENMVKELSTQFQFFNTNTSEFKNWHAKYIEYLKEIKHD